MTSQLIIPEKIAQLQCAQCDVGLRSQFLHWFTSSFKYQSNILSKIHNEIELLLGFAQYRLTVGMNKAQPGDYLQNIQYVSLSKKQKILWLLFSVIFPYLLRKISAYSATKQTQFWQSVFHAIAKIQKIVTILQFVNYAIFILKGQYRSLIQRVLKMRMKFIDPENKRILNFSLMNRMLVWQVYQLFLKTVLPHIFSFCSGPLKNLFYLSSYLQPDVSQNQRTCVFCTSDQPVMPQKAHPCQHKACYYCCKTAKSSKCPLCSQLIERWVPLC